MLAFWDEINVNHLICFSDALLFWSDPYRHVLAWFNTFYYFHLGASWQRPTCQPWVLKETQSSQQHPVQRTPTHWCRPRRQVLTGHLQALHMSLNPCVIAENWPTLQRQGEWDRTLTVLGSKWIVPLVQWFFL